MVSTPEPRDVTFRFLVADPQNLAIGDVPTEVWSASPVILPDGVWVDMYNEIFRIEPPGKILWVEFYIKYRVQAATVAATTVIERIRARNLRGVYQNISNELTTAAIGLAWVTRITKGTVNPRTAGEGAANFDRQPFEILIQLQNDTINEGRLEVSSLSYVRVVYEEA